MARPSSCRVTRPRAGWYESGATPGEPGPTITAGRDRRGVFDRLTALKIGAHVDVRRTDGALVSYRVDEIATYPARAFPAAEVYEPTSTSTLRNRHVRRPAEAGTAARPRRRLRPSDFRPLLTRRVPVSQYVAHHSRMNRKQPVSQYAARHSRAVKATADQYVGRHALLSGRPVGRLRSRKGGWTRFLVPVLFLLGPLLALLGSTSGSATRSDHTSGYGGWVDRS